MRFFICLIVNVFINMHSTNEETNVVDQEPNQDIITSDEQENSDNVSDSQSYEPKNITDDDIARLMDNIKNNSEYSGQQETIKKMCSVEYYKNLTFFIIASGLSIGSLGWVHYHIKQHHNNYLSILNYVLMLLAARLILMGASYLYFFNNTTDDCVDMSNKIFNMVRIFSILAIIFVIGIVGYLDSKLIPMCIPYVLIEGFIMYKYLMPCRGCCD